MALTAHQRRSIREQIGRACQVFLATASAAADEIVLSPAARPEDNDDALLELARAEKQLRTLRDLLERLRNAGLDKETR